jgi:hypothetical protein
MRLQQPDERLAMIDDRLLLLRAYPGSTVPIIIACEHIGRAIAEGLKYLALADDEVRTPFQALHAAAIEFVNKSRSAPGKII